MKHVVIGGGPSGVIYALKVKKDYPNDKVVIIESSDKLLKEYLYLEMEELIFSIKNF